MPSDEIMCLKNAIDYFLMWHLVLNQFSYPQEYFFPLYYKVVLGICTAWKRQKNRTLLVYFNLPITWAGIWFWKIRWSWHLGKEFFDRREMEVFTFNGYVKRSWVKTYPEFSVWFFNDYKYVNQAGWFLGRFNDI